jgi:hypothetical protein
MEMPPWKNDEMNKRSQVDNHVVDGLNVFKGIHIPQSSPWGRRLGSFDYPTSLTVKMECWDGDSALGSSSSVPRLSYPEPAPRYTVILTIKSTSPLDHWRA